MKKKYAEPEMGYCPLSMRQARARRRRAAQVQDGTEHATAGVGAQGGRAERERQVARRRGARDKGGDTGAGRAAWACCWASGVCTWCT